MLKKGNNETAKDQSGIVSLIVVSILAVVLGLVAVGFSKLMDRELRQSLDRELSAQAYYSAVAGLNDAVAYVFGGNPGFNSCNGWSNSSYFSNDLSGGSKIAKYSCITIDTNPDYLVYELKPDESVTFNINKPNMGRMYFGWEKDPINKPPPLGPGFVALGNTGQLPQESNPPSNATGLLEVGLYPIPNNCKGVPNTDACLAANSANYFLYPNANSNNSPGVAPYTIGDYSQASGPSGSNGKFVPGNCSTTNNFVVLGASPSTKRQCNAYIDNLQALSSNYYVRLTARYSPVIVTVQVTNGGGQSLGAIGNVQAVIDVTGQGTDVLQRIRARVALSHQVQVPAFGLQSMDSLCKGFDAQVSSPTAYNTITLDPNVQTFNTDSTCITPTSGGNISGLPTDQPSH